MTHKTVLNIKRAALRPANLNFISFAHEIMCVSERYNAGVEYRIIVSRGQRLLLSMCCRPMRLRRG